MTAAVVLNYRTPERTIGAVRSLQASTIPPTSILVVDNASGDGSIDRLRAEVTGARLIAAETNGGFSAGCNLGIREAIRSGADRILILNGDVVVATDMIERLAAVMDANPSCGIAGPALVSADGPDRIESTGIRYWPASGRIRHQDHDALVSPAQFATKPVDGVTGCAMLITREVFDRAGPFAEDFFFGFEDLDFCLRAREAGFVAMCAGGAVAWHEGSASIGRSSPARAYFAARNQLLLASRTPARSRIASALRALSVIGLNVAHAAKQSEVPRVRALRAVARGTADHFRRRYGPAPGDLQREEDSG